jgi:hypothetical protein
MSIMMYLLRNLLATLANPMVVSLVTFFEHIRAYRLNSDTHDCNINHRMGDPIEGILNASNPYVGFNVEAFLLEPDEILAVFSEQL